MPAGELPGVPTPGVAQVATPPIVATPAVATVEPATLPEGRPADQATVEAVTAAVGELLACANAGDIQRTFALVSDDFLRRLAAEQPPTDEDLAFLAATPVPVAEQDRIALLAVRDVRMLPDGRVAATIETDDPAAPPAGPETDRLIFVERDGGYLLDQIIEGPEGAVGAATPGP